MLVVQLVRPDVTLLFVAWDTFGQPIPIPVQFEHEDTVIVSLNGVDY
jgi:hypothetical protein